MNATGSFGKRFLVPLDGSDRGELAAATAATLAAVAGAEIEFISVVSAEDERDERQRYLDTVQRSFGHGLVTQSTVRTGPQVGKELSLEIDDETSLVMLTGATLAPHAGHFGSIAERIVRTTTRPSLLIGPNVSAALTDIRRVLLAVDGSETAEQAASAACEVAAAFKAQLWVVTVVSADQAAAAAAVGLIMETNYVRRVAELACPGFAAEYDVLHNDDPVAGILDFANESDIIVLTTHGRSGVNRLVAGSVTTGVVRKALTPVVVVPPLFRGQSVDHEGAP